MTNNVRWVGTLIATPVIGFLCFLLPLVAVGGLEHLAGIEALNFVSRVFESNHPAPAGILLVLSGFAVRSFAGRGTWVLALLLVAVFPIATTYGLFMEPGQHNLFPFEYGIQLMFVLPALLGTGVAAALDKRRQAR